MGEQTTGAACPALSSVPGLLLKQDTRKEPTASHEHHHPLHGFRPLEPRVFGAAYLGISIVLLARTPTLDARLSACFAICTLLYLVLWVPRTFPAPFENTQYICMQRVAERVAHHQKDPFFHYHDVE